jgi:NMT1-like family
MLGFNRWHLLRGLAAILCIAGIVSLALIYFFPAPPLTISMAVGFKGPSYELLAARYKDILSRAHVKLEIHNTAGGAEHFKLLQDQNSGVPAAMVQGGISDSEHAPGLLSLGSINYQIFCVFYRATEVLDDLTELKGKRIAVGPVGSGSRVVAERVLGISGITSETSTLFPFAGQAAVNALNDGRTDAAILGLSSDSPLIQSLLRDPRVRLMSVTRAEALTRIFSFLVRLVLPQGVIDLRGIFRPAILSSSRPPTLYSCAMIFIPHLLVSWHRHWWKRTINLDFFNEPASSPLRAILNFPLLQRLWISTRTVLHC